MSDRDPKDLKKDDYIKGLEFMNEQLRREQESIERRLGLVKSILKADRTPVTTWKQTLFKALVRLMRLG